MKGSFYHRRNETRRVELMIIDIGCPLSAFSPNLERCPSYKPPVTLAPRQQLRRQSFLLPVEDGTASSATSVSPSAAVSPKGAKASALSITVIKLSTDTSTLLLPRRTTKEGMSIGELRVEMELIRWVGTESSSVTRKSRYQAVAPIVRSSLNPLPPKPIPLFLKRWLVDPPPSIRTLARHSSYPCI